MGKLIANSSLFTVQHSLLFAVERFTSERCKSILANPLNSHNRPLRKAKIAEMSNSMAAGEWELNGQTIVFGVNPDELLGGFHRVTSCAESGHPFISCVVYGVAKKAQPTMDTGSPQTSPDALAFKHEVWPKELNNMLAGINHYRCKRFSKDKGPSTSLENGLRATNAQYQSVLENHPKVRESLAFVHDTAARGLSPLVSRHTVALVHYLAKEIAQNPDAADEWAASILNCDGVRATSSIFKARELLLKPALSLYSQKLYTLINSYNRHVEGKQGLSGGGAAKAYTQLIGAPPEAL